MGILDHPAGLYDLIILPLTDSVIRVSAMAQLRLENYLFKVESAPRAPFHSGVKSIHK